MMGNTSYSVKTVNKNEWDEIIKKFDDSNIYQTVVFNKLSLGGDHIEQFTLKRDDEVIAACLLRIKTIPYLNRGIAYLRWGPMWRRKKSKIDQNTFNLTIRKLREEYCIKRKLILHISSNLFYEEKWISSDNFLKENYKQNENYSKTILIDLTKDENELKINFRKKWRYTLKQSEKNELTVEHNSSQEYFQLFLNIYSEMIVRKKFTEYVDPNKFMEINSQLPKEQKMEIFVCKNNNKPISSIVLSTLGHTGIYLLGSSSSLGLDLYSSYFLQWEAMKWLKSEGFKWYDLGGIDKVENPGVYTFKSGMGGKELTFLGNYSSGDNVASNLIVNIGKYIKKWK